MRVVRIAVVALVLGAVVLLGREVSGEMNNHPDPDRLIAIELQHDSEASKILRFPQGYLAQGFETGKGLEDGPLVTEQVTIAFTHPGMDIPQPDDPVIGDCRDSGQCIYYAGLQLTETGVTERFYRSTVARDATHIDPNLISHDADDIPGIDKVFAASWRVSYYSPPGKNTRSAVLINCERATEAHEARCRVFFETDKAIAVVVGGVSRSDLTEWRSLISDITAFVDQSVI